MQKALSGATSQKAEGLDPRAALKILEDRARGHDDAAIRDTDLGEVLFEYLAEHGAPATRQAVAANKAVPAYVNRTLANDTVEAVRAELAVKIARLMPGLEARESEEVVALTIATLEVLAKDRAVKVRSVLAEEIKHMDCIPHDIALRLAHDLEEIVAAPILEYSPLLSDTDLVEVIAAGKVQKVLTAIARRKPGSWIACTASNRRPSKRYSSSQYSAFSMKNERTSGWRKSIASPHGVVRSCRQNAEA